MSSKIEMTKEQVAHHSKKILEIVRDNDYFFFYFSPDPDAVGVSVAFSLFLKNRNKKSLIYLPEGFNSNLDFIFKIANYNDIKIIKDIDDVCSYLKENEYVFVTCDTATHHLLPNYNRIIEIKKGYFFQQSIELDHHFGGDSEKIYEESFTLYYKANSSCEMLSDFFYYANSLEATKSELYLYFPRNIVLCLLVGICFDTQFGKFLVNVAEYEKWFYFLSERLEYLTWDNSENISSGEEVYSSINRMSEVKLKTINQLVDKADMTNEVGLIIIPPVRIYDSLAEDGDSTCILSKIVSDIVNLLSDRSGKVGILAYYDDHREIFYLKIRRSLSFKEFDLREAGEILQEMFKGSYSGGGGHAGATSFRLKDITREEFIDKVKVFKTRLVKSMFN